MTRPAPAILLALPLLAAACSGSDGAERAVRTDSAGIAIVTSPGTDRPLEWSLVPEGSVGGDEVYRFSRWSVGVDDSGVIHVLDYDGKRVLRYGPDGSPMDELGRPGQGPGELTWPSMLDVAPDGRVRVADIGRHREITWAPDGTLEGEDPGLDPNSSSRRVADGEVVQVQRLEATTAQQVLLRVNEGGDTTRLAAVETTSRPITLESCGMSFSGMSPVMAPRLIWDARGPRLAVVSGAAYDIAVHDGGDPAMRVRRDIELQPATEELAITDVGEGMKVRTEGGTRVCAPEDVVSQRGVAEHAPLLEDLLVDPAGRIWARRFNAGDEPGQIDVFDETGEYLGTLPAETPMPVAFLPDGRALVVETDAMDVQRLVIARIDEGDAGG